MTRPVSVAQRKAELRAMQRWVDVESIKAHETGDIEARKAFVFVSQKIALDLGRIHGRPDNHILYIPDPESSSDSEDKDD